MQRNALLFGLTLDEFLYGNPLLFYLYQDLYIEKTRIENIRLDAIAWQQGFYFLRAFRQNMKEAGFIKGGGDKTEYPSKPFYEIAENNNPANKAELIKAKVLARAEQIRKNTQK
jgi:hypothetical protein